METHNTSFTLEPLQHSHTHNIKKLATLIAGEQTKYPSPAYISALEKYCKEHLTDPYNAGAFLIMNKKSIIGAIWLQKDLIQSSHEQPDTVAIGRITLYFALRTNNTDLHQQNTGKTAAKFLIDHYSEHFTSATITYAVIYDQPTVAMSSFVEGLSHNGAMVATRANMVRKVHTPYYQVRALDSKTQIIPCTSDHIQSLMPICWRCHHEMGDLDFMSNMASQESWIERSLMNIKTSLSYSFIPEASFTAVHDNKLVGGLWAVRPMYAVDTAFIMNVFVDPTLQGLGIGTNLLHTTILAIDQLNIFESLKLAVSCHVSTPSLYEKFGFTIESTYQQFGYQKKQEPSNL